MSISLCAHDRTKTAETTITKLATGIIHHVMASHLILGQKVKGQECYVLNLLVILHSSDTQYFYVYFTVKTKAYKVIIYHAVQLWLLFKTVISFCLNSTVKPYNITAKLGTFFMIHPVFWTCSSIEQANICRIFWKWLFGHRSLNPSCRWNH